MTSILQELRALANPEKAEFLKRYFKTGPGEYADGDLFLGLMVPQTRAVAKKHRDLSLDDLQKLFESSYHEERLAALFILVDQFARTDESLRKKIFKFYLRNIRHINNWDLVDTSAAEIVGGYLDDKPKSILAKLARSKNLWERRISIIATYWFIKRGEYGETLKIAELLLSDKHDLIHKAVGWMLREVGNRSLETEEVFLRSHYKQMPRTMLRYAIEKFPEKKRKKYQGTRSLTGRQLEQLRDRPI